MPCMRVKFYKHCNGKRNAHFLFKSSDFYALPLVPVFDVLAFFDSSTASAFFLFLPNSILLYLQKQWAANNADEIYMKEMRENYKYRVFLGIMSFCLSSSASAAVPRFGAFFFFASIADTLPVSSLSSSSKIFATAASPSSS